MERGQLIAYHRRRLHLTQAELGEKVNVTAQAISKWEKGLSEPDLSTIQRLSKIFEIDVTDFFAEEPTEGEKETAIAQATAQAPSTEGPTPARVPIIEKEPDREPPKIIVGYCDKCKRPIDQRERYTVERVGRSSTQRLYCPECKHKMDVSHADHKLSHGRKMFRRSMIWGTVAAIAVVILIAVLAIVFANPVYLLGLVFSLFAFTFTAQCFWDGFILEFLMFFMHSFRMPMLIFQLSLNGIVWFITVKLLLMILSGFLSVLLFLFGLFLTLLVSFFAFPFCLIKELHELRDLNATAARVRAE